MNKIIIPFTIGVLIGGFVISLANDPKPFSLPSQSIKDNNHTRYFFIGYTINDEQRGNIYWQCNDGQLPMKDEIISFCHKSKEIRPFKSESFIILSLYEFKNKKDRDFFMHH